MELEVINQNEITIAFNTDNGIQAVIDNIRSQVDEQITGIVWDFTKEKDKKLVASLAHKVARSKTAIDNEGKKLKEQYTAITSKIDAERKLAREALDAEKDRIRKPLTDWENAEKERIARHENSIKEIKDFLLPENINVDAEVLASNIRYLEKVPMGTMFEEFEEKIKLAKFETLEALRTALASRERYEAEQAELEALRIAEQERIKREHEEHIAREATEKAQREAEEKARLEAERFQHEKLEAEQREARLKAEKEQALIREEQLKQQAIEDAKQAEINKQKAIEAERQRIEFERLAKEEAERKEEQQRLDNVEYMRKVNNSILSALLQTGITENQAKAVIKMIAKNEVPNVSIKY
jgi:colicin import membrane protein